MRTNVAQTSIEAYDHLKLEGLNERQREIVEVMVHGSLYSRRQLAFLAGLETSCVSGRVFELIQDGILEVCGRIHCPITNISVEAVKLVEKQQQELFTQ